jgi:diguanylate cyclase (GGDEF)-like protein
MYMKTPQSIYWREVGVVTSATVGISLVFYFHLFSSSWIVALDNFIQVLFPLPLLVITCHSLYHTWRVRTSSIAFWQVSRASLVMVLAVICDLIGQSVWLYYAQFLHIAVPSPSIGDLAYLMTDPLLLLGILFIRTRSLTAVEQSRSLLDGLIIMIALATFSWYFILGPTIAQGSESVLGKIVNISYPVCDLLLIFCLVFLLGRQTAYSSLRSVMVSVMIGLGAVVLADSIFAYQTLQGTYVSGELIDILWPLGDMCYLITAHALLLRQQYQYEQNTPSLRETRFPRLWVTVIPYLLLPATAALLWYIHVVRKDETFDKGVYIGVALLVLCIVVRQIVTLREFHQHLRQEHHLKQEIQQAHEELQRQHNALLLANGELTGLHQQLAQQNLQLRTTNEQLSALAITDPLTGLYNHRFFQEMLGKELANAASQSLPVALLMLDIDHFRQFNEMYGHDVGDRVLKVVAQTLHMDIRPGSHSARYGGEEFVVILPGADRNQADIIAERLRSNIAQARLVVEHQVSPVTVSIGYACFPMHASVASSLLKAADLACANTRHNCLSSKHPFFHQILHSVYPRVQT